MRHGFLAPVVALGMAMAGVPASASTFDFVSQDRSVSATSFVDSSSVSHVAPDFGPFSESATVYGASASHTSRLDPTEIELRLTAGGGDAANASARFEVEFSLSEATAYTLTGFTFASSGGLPGVILEEVGGAVIFASPTFFPPYDTFEDQGILPAGSYVLRSGAFYGGFTGDQDVGALLVIPEPGTAGLAVVGLLALRALRRTPPRHV